MNTPHVLSKAQIDSFFSKGYLVLNNAVNTSMSDKWIEFAYTRLGYKKDDPRSWEKDIVWMDHHHQVPVHEIAPKAWDAILELVGGEDRIEPKVMAIESKHFSTINTFTWSDSFIVNFRRGADAPWQPPSAKVGGWHKDGSYFRHFLDSREQALLPIVCWGDMLHQGGGTFVATDSVRLMARFLADHPEGVHPGDFKFQEMVAKCTQFEEITGKAGDVVLIHPFMLHASSQNVLGRPRFMSNPPVVLKEPMNFNRANPAEFSLLERATLHYLGVDRLDFRPTAPRESFWWEHAAA